MLALSAVLILFIVCVVCCPFVCFPFQFLYVLCLRRLQYCVCVKSIDALPGKNADFDSLVPGKNAECLIKCLIA